MQNSFFVRNSLHTQYRSIKDCVQFLVGVYIEFPIIWYGYLIKALAQKIAVDCSVQQILRVKLNYL